MTGPLLITGASGWFGRTALWEYEQEHGPDALRRDVIPFSSGERWVDFGSLHGPVKALPLKAITEVQNPRGLLHLAFLTRDKEEVLGWRRYVDINRSITAGLFATLNAWPNMPVVSTSSGAAAALDGKVLDLEGNPYAALKKEEEAVILEASSIRNACIFRVYAASGRFMARREKYALGSFLTQAIASGRITVQARGKVFRSYVNAGDLMRLAFKMLADSCSDAGFALIDACNVDVELHDLAVLVASLTRTYVASPVASMKTKESRYVGSHKDYLLLMKKYNLFPLSLEHQVLDTLRGFNLLPNSHHGI